MTTKFITCAAMENVQMAAAVERIRPSHRPDDDYSNIYYVNESRTVELECTQDDVDSYATDTSVVFDSADVLDDRALTHFIEWLKNEELIHGECYDGPGPDVSVWDAITEAFGEAGAYAVSKVALERLQAMSVDTPCGKDCKAAIDGTKKILGTLGRLPPRHGDDGETLIRLCVDAVEIMVCG